MRARRGATVVGLVAALGCAPSAAPRAQDHAQVADDAKGATAPETAPSPAPPPPPPPPLAPAPGCGEPSSAPGALPEALRREHAVLADAVLKIGEEVELPGAVLRAELRDPPLWLGEGPPQSSPALVYRRRKRPREDADLVLDRMVPVGQNVVDGRRVNHRWTEAKDAVWVHVTDNACPVEHEQLERPEPGAPMWIWLSTQGIAVAKLGHADTSQLDMRLWWTPEAPYLSFDQSASESLANLGGGFHLSANTERALTLGPARIVVEEVLVGELRPSRGEAVGEQAHPEVHARIRVEVSEPPSEPRFPTSAAGASAAERCGDPSPRRTSDTQPLGSPRSLGARSLVLGETLHLPGIELRLELQPIPGLPEKTRPLVLAEFPGAGERSSERAWQFPWVLRAGDTLLWIDHEADAEAAMRVEIFEVSCSEELNAPMPTEPTLVWLGSGGHARVTLGDPDGEHIRLEYRDDPPNRPQVMIASSSPRHGARSLNFRADPEAKPVALDTGSAWILGSWEIHRIADPVANGGPWHAVAIPLMPHRAAAPLP